MHRLALVAAALCSCGRIGFDFRLAATGDAAVDARACTFGPWGTPVRVAQLSSAGADYGGQVSLDGLSYYLMQENDLFASTRATRTSLWSTPVHLDALDSPSYEPEMAISADQLETYFTSDRSLSRQCIFHADRTDPHGTFGNVALLDALCADGPVAGSYVTPDNLTLYYNTEAGSPEGTLMTTTRGSPTDAWVAGTPIAELQFIFDMGYPFLAADALTLYFEGGSVHQLYQSSRDDLASPWQTPIPIPNINTPEITEDVSLTGDGLEMYFASGRPGSVGGDDIWVATRSCD